MPTLSTLEHLNLGHNIHRLNLLPRQDEIESTQWPELLHPFTSVKNLHILEKVAPCLAPALQELTGECITEVLPALQNIFVDGFGVSPLVEEAIGQFVATRQLSGRPVAVHHW